MALRNTTSAFPTDYSKFNSVQEYKDAVNAWYKSQMRGGAGSIMTVGSPQMKAWQQASQAMSAENLRAVEKAIAQAKGNKLTTEYQSAYNEAKQENETRYEDILGQYQSRYTQGLGDFDAYNKEILSASDTLNSQVMSGFEGLGEAEKADIRRSYAASGAAQAQNLVNSGLYSTTTAPAVQRQNATAEANAIGLADEGLRREKLGYMTQLGGQKLDLMTQLGGQRIGYSTGMSKEMLDFMAQREDTYPSESLYVQMMQMLGNN